MEKPSTDNRIVMTLDAGGTNLVFSAVCDNRLIIDPITLPSSGNDLDRCLQSMVHGFEAVKQLLPQPPVAISFAFPGPADYPNGIIGGNLPNFPAFRSGVALGPFLQDKFGIPVFINNDGDLFAYGEAFAGRLPEINAKLEALGSPKRYHNLIGYTFGTGFGVGIVSGGRLHIGDNSCVETFCLYNCIDTGNIAEATVSAVGIRREYARLTGNNAEIDTKEIYDIADGTREGDQQAAQQAFATFGTVAGHAIAAAASLIDGIVVLGGGVAHGQKFFMPALMAQLRGTRLNYNGDVFSCVQPQVYNLDDEQEFNQFAQGNAHKLQVYGSKRMVDYDPHKRIGITLSRIGSSRAIQLGAAAYALNNIPQL